MKHIFLFVILAVIVNSVLGQSQRPKIGLTLSGGGAKGLAHIGILKAIDSAGLKIDYVTGTSMGSIMGALYATGYSGKEIEKIARKIDWVSMFSNRPPIELVNMNEKKEFSNYAVEVPLERGKAKAKFYSGFIEAEEIWLKFGELFYPVHDIKDFSKFSIPFSCVATDIATGKAVVLKQGEIVKAIRSSMAIPSIFSAVQYNDTKLVDGGVVRNFPVSDARAMGADYVIGVNLSQGLLTAERLVSPIDMIYQIAFYKDAESFDAEKKLCNVLIEPVLEGFSAGSFGAADSIISIGNETGKKFYPQFKRLADSLKAIYPDAVPEADRLPQKSEVVIDNIEITGLEFATFEDFTGKTGLAIGKSYTGKEISEGARKAFGTGNFRRVAFFVEPIKPGHVRLRYEVIENLPTYFKAGIHYNSYTDIALITTLSTRNLLLKRSKSFAKINWSDNARLLLRHDQSFGKKQRWGSLLSFYHERFKFPIFENLKPAYDYRSIYSSAEYRLYRLFGTTSMMSAGLSHEWLKLDPIISPNLNLVFYNDYWNFNVGFQHNTLDAKIFPRRGTTIDLSAGIIFGQSPHLTFTIADSIPVSSDSLSLNFRAYQQLKVKAAHFFPLHRRWTLMTQFNTGINFNYEDSFLNFYSVGGINDFVRNQIPFVGLGGNQVNTNSVTSGLIGIQYEPFTNIFTTLRANVGLVDFIDVKPADWTQKNFLSGYALSGGYRSAIGPIEISLIYNDQSKSFKGYVNLGFTF